MAWMTEKSLAAQVALTGYVTGMFDRLRSQDRERGALGVEYMAVVILVVAIMLIVIGAKTEIGEAITGTITKKIEELSKAGG